MRKIVAVIDIGTQTARLLVANADEQKVKLEPVARDIRGVRLGEGVDALGHLSQAAMARAADAVADFARQARALGAVEIYAFATSATRDAANRDELISLLQQRAGVALDVLDGEQEAQVAFRGAVGLRPGIQGVIDIGGGSTEVLIGRDGKPLFSRSLQMGAVRAGERFGCFGVQAYDALRAGVEEMFRNLAQEIAALALPAPCWTGVAGTLTTLAMWQLGLGQYQPEKVQNFMLTARDTGRLADKLYRMDREARLGIPGLAPYRADIIGPGAGIASSLMQALVIGEIRISDSDNLEGYLYQKVLHALK
ncbi:hypothetical protein H8699_00170 [Christensenellaceae bacterium NSJ-44]|uniref:Ppx/GppA phosphatase N-terminal domain-containing protein n=1 Tax=Luoshenia tenuis TaxID=2763654 RepID=A0A926CY41_9FIRM|nr:hypothetical protein [Luoshenia tenuis]MBC8527851.1 hypothetical protein [Luoshenia tenuis]